MTAWNFEYRAFVQTEPADVMGTVNNAAKTAGFTKKTQKETDVYCVGGATEIAVCLRGDKVKMKGPVKAVDDIVDEMTDNRAFLPVESNVISDALGLAKDTKPKTLKTVDEVKAYMKKKGSKTSTVEKDMTKFESSSLEIEVSSLKIDGAPVWTICVAGHDAKTVREAVEKYGIKGLGTKMHYAEAVRQMGQ